MQWKGDTAASPGRGAAGTQGAALSFASEHPTGFRGACETNRKKDSKTTQKAQGVGGEGKRQLRVGLGTPPSCQEALQKREAALRRGKGGGGRREGAVGTPRPLASRGGRWCGGGMAGGGGRPCSPPRGLLGMAAAVVVAAAAAGWGALVGGTKRPAAVGPPQAWFSSGGCCGVWWYRGMGAALLGEGAMVACRTDPRHLIKAMRWRWG